MNNATADSVEVELPPQSGAPAVASTVGSIGSLLSVLGVKTCCVIPFALVSFGIGGSWIGFLTAFAPYQPIFVASTLGFIAFGLASVYRRSAAVCEPGQACAPPAAMGWQKASLWTAATLLAGTLAFPYVVQWLDL
jgi:mercuric ion transport protein